MICSLVVLRSKDAQMKVCSTRVRHEESRHQKQGAEKSVIVGFPSQRTTSLEIRHIRARHEEIHHRLLACHVSLSTCADRPAPSLAQSKLWILRFPSGPNRVIRANRKFE